MRRQLDEIVAKKQGEYPSLAVKKFFCADDVERQDGELFLSSTSLFEAGKKICIIEGCATFVSDDFAWVEKMARYSLGSSSMVFFIDVAKENVLPPLYKKILDLFPHKLITFSFPSEQALIARARDYVKKQGYLFTQDALAFLVRSLRTDAQALFNTLDVFGGSGREVSLQTLAQNYRGSLDVLSGYTVGRNITFAPTRAQKLLYLEQAFMAHVDSMWIFNVLAQYASTSHQVDALLFIDQKIKTGGMTPQDALTYFSLVV